jgi:hypothetical protein
VSMKTRNESLTYWSMTSKISFMPNGSFVSTSFPQFKVSCPRPAKNGSLSFRRFDLTVATLHLLP